MEIDGSAIPNPELAKTALGDLLKKAGSETVTIMGIVYGVQAAQEVACRDGKTRRKQTVSVVDDSYCIVHVTLWEAYAGAVDGKEGEVVELQNLEVEDFRGKRTLGSGALS